MSCYPFILLFFFCSRAGQEQGHVWEGEIFLSFVERLRECPGTFRKSAALILSFSAGTRDGAALWTQLECKQGAS